MEQSEQIHFEHKESLKPPRHRRLSFDKDELKRLADNIATQSMQNPIVCLPTREIISGDRRWSAAMLDDRIKLVPVRFVTDPLTAKEIRTRRISENLHRKDISAFERYLECQGFREDEPGITAKEMADLLSVDPSTITRYLSPADCIEPVRKALRDDLIGIKAVYEISKESPERQADLLAEALAGGAGQVAKARRKTDATVPASAKVGKLKFALPSGSVVTLSSGDKPLSMDDAVRELTEALAELKAASKMKDTLKSFMERCKSRGKAGGDVLPAPDDPICFEVSNG